MQETPPSAMIDTYTAKAVMQWYSDQGIDVILEDTPQDRTQIQEASPTTSAPLPQNTPQPQSAAQQAAAAASSVKNTPVLGASEARQEAVKLASQAQTLEELQKAIAEFDGITLKKTATNLVFGDGNPKADIMLIGEAPGDDEDRIGKPFAGAGGNLLDTILSYIDLDRTGDDPSKAIYLTNILNWRPPGNRSPSPGEIDASFPFIERHIQLVEPKILILCGGVCAKALLNRSEGISRLRSKWHEYQMLTPELGAKTDQKNIQALATYHPTYLLRTPLQKRAIWADMLMLKKQMLQL